VTSSNDRSHRLPSYFHLPRCFRSPLGFVMKADSHLPRFPLQRWSLIALRCQWLIWLQRLHPSSPGSRYVLHWRGLAAFASGAPQLSVFISKKMNKCWGHKFILCINGVGSLCFPNPLLVLKSYPRIS